MTEPIRLIIADDHALFRRGLVELLREQADFRIIGEAHSGPDAVELAKKNPADVVLMDVHMPEGSGIDAVRVLKRISTMRILMLTISSADESLLGAISAGADGYLLKSAEPEELCDAIRRVAAGGSYLSQDVARAVMRAAAQSPANHANQVLSDRELEILACLARGSTNREMASKLIISPNTVKTHVHNILKKLGASNRAEAVARAASQGLIH
jgi:DNA-binding NarL/FixJ family response regulator